LIWWRFRRHRLAVAGTIVIAGLYLYGIFASFVAPFDPVERDPKYVQAPPQRVRIFHEGRLRSPFVYDMSYEFDPVTANRIFVEVTSEPHPIGLFVRGDPYKLWGLFPSDLHLFGRHDGGALYVLGTDLLGRDMFSRICYGTRVSLSVGLIGVFLSLLLGLVMGGIAGYFGGAADTIIQRVSEVIRSFPSIPLWMALSAALPDTWSPLAVYFGVTIILSLRGWTSLARQARGKIMSIKNDDFVLAARLSGASIGRILRVHLIPSFTSHIIATLTLAIPQMILGETALSFLGIGLRDPIISWGVLMQKAQNVHTLAFAPWLLWPTAFVIVSILAFSFMGDGLRDAADPYAVIRS
jgi:peptide/nickel transport system permease protein